MESAIAELRNILGMSQRRFAEMAGVSQSHISDVEHGLARPCDRLRSFLFRLETLSRQVLEDLQPPIRTQ